MIKEVNLRRLRGLFMLTRWNPLKALIRSSEYLNNRQDLGLGAIYRCTSGVVFLGTPHRGSEQTGLADIVSRIARVALRQPNKHIVRNLAEDSDVLERQRKSFASISERLSLVCLFEEVPTSIGLVISLRSFHNTYRFIAYKWLDCSSALRLY